MQRIQSTIYKAIIISELGHVFCCGLPTLFSIASLMANAGFISFMPPSLVYFHSLMHAYELPMIFFSGCILLTGIGLHYCSQKLDCRSTGCVHEPCKPKKKKAGTVLLIATLLYVVNVAFYFGVHRHAPLPDPTHAHEHGVQEEHAGHSL